MKRLVIPAFLMLIGLNSCLEEVEGPDSQFIKIFGKESDSQAFGIQENPDGTLFILGQTSTAGFDFELIPGGGQFTSSTINRAPSLTIANPSGNIIDRFLYPLPDYSDSLNNQFINFWDPNRAVLNSIHELSDGGYLALGAWMGLDVPGNPDINTLNMPFLIWLNEDFSFQKIELINGASGWDFIVRNEPEIYRNPDGGLTLFYRGVLDFSTQWLGYGIRIFNADGSDPNGQPDEKFSEFQKYPYVFQGWDLQFLNNGNILVIGQIGNGIFLEEAVPSVIRDCPYFINNNCIGFENFNSLSPTNEQGPADRGDLIRTMEDDYVALYDSFPDVMVHRFNYENGNFTTTFRKPITNFGERQTGEGEFIRDAVQTRDGGFLVLTEVVRQGDFDSAGKVIRLNTIGAIQWTYEFSGNPRIVKESLDGGVFVLFNPQFNSLTTKSTLIKLTSDGKL